MLFVGDFVCITNEIGLLHLKFAQSIAAICGVEAEMLLKGTRLENMSF